MAAAWLPALALAATAAPPSVAPAIVFAADPSVRDGGAVFPDLYAVRPDGTRLRRITRTPHGEVEPAASPNGRWIAFFAPARGIGVVRPDGSGYRILVKERHDVGPWGWPSWSPDSRWIAFVDDPYQHVWLVHPDGSGLHGLAAGPAGATSPSWYPDGRSLLVENGNRELWRISSSSGKPLAPVVYPTTPPIGYPQNPTLSPDGRLVALNGCGGHLCEETFPLYLLRQGQTTLRLLAPDSGRPAWLPDSTRILYATGHVLVRLDVRTGSRRVVFRAPYGLEGVTWVPAPRVQ